MKSSRDSLGWKITAALLFLALVACAFSCALGAVYLHGAGFGKSASYFQCETCLELVEQRRFQVARALYLQRELEGIALEYAVPRYQVLGAYRWDDLDPLVQAADRAEAELTAAIRQSGGIIKEYDSWEDFLAARL